MIILEHQLVDWEPLNVELVYSSTMSAIEKKNLKNWLTEWFKKHSVQESDDCDIRNWNIATTRKSLRFSIELISSHRLKQLLSAVSEQFPGITKALIGEPCDLSKSLLKALTFYAMPPESEDPAEMNVITSPEQDAAFSISLNPVSRAQFEEFIEHEQYVPQADCENGMGNFSAINRRLAGKQLLSPVFGVTLRDAQAYAKFHDFRLPSSHELLRFFYSTALKGIEFEWSGPCWSTTQDSEGLHELWDGPYLHTVSRGLPVEHFRSSWPPNHWDYPFPTFRVVKGA